MGLKLKLKAGEKVYINGTLVENGSTTAELQILNRVPILREKDILLEKDADSPCKQVYFVVQTLYFSPSDENAVLQLLSKLSIEIIKAAPSLASHFEKLFELVGSKKYYSALKFVREIIQLENQLIENAQSAQ